jgi:hypothetical protein
MRSPAYLVSASTVDLVGEKLGRGKLFLKNDWSFPAV